MAFALSGASTVLLASGRLATGQVLAFVVLLFAALLGLGHVFPDADLYEILPGTGVSILTALAFGALSAGGAPGRAVRCRDGRAPARVGVDRAAG